MKKPKIPTVSEIINLLPLSEVFEMKKHHRYLIKIRPSRIVSGSGMSGITPQKLQELKDWFERNNIQGFLLIVEGDDINIVELKAN